MTLEDKAMSPKVPDQVSAAHARIDESSTGRSSALLALRSIDAFAQEIEDRKVPSMVDARGAFLKIDEAIARLRAIVANASRADFDERRRQLDEEEAALNLDTGRGKTKAKSGGGKTGVTRVRLSEDVKGEIRDAVIGHLNAHKHKKDDKTYEGESFGSILKGVQAKHPSWNDGNVREAINTLKEKKLIRDNGKERAQMRYFAK